MTRADIARRWATGRCEIIYNGERWSLARPSVTSDGFLTAWGTLVLPADVLAALEPWEIPGHSFFLGQLDTNPGGAR